MAATVRCRTALRPCNTVYVSEYFDVDTTLARAEQTLRESGALFAYLHGSRAQGEARTGSDIDVAAFFGRRNLHSWDVLLPDAVDLLVLDTAPLELAGRVALAGVLLFEEDPDARVHWEATTRKVYLDERPRMQRAHKEFLESLQHD